MEREAFDKLIVDQLPALLRFCIRLTGDPIAGEDLAHDGIERALRRRTTLRDPRRARAWLFSITINCFRDGLRRHETEQLREADAAAIPESSDARELGEQVAAAVSKLPPRQREVIVLVAYEGFSTAEAATVLEMTDQNVRTTLHLARAKLKQQLAGYLSSERR